MAVIYSTHSTKILKNKNSYIKMGSYTIKRKFVIHFPTLLYFSIQQHVTGNCKHIQGVSKLMVHTLGGDRTHQDE